MRLLSQHHGITIAAPSLVSFIEQRKADFYTGRDKAIYHHNLALVIAEVLEKDLVHPLPDKVISSLLYEYRKVSRGYAILHHKNLPEILATLATTYTLAVASYTQSSFTEPELDELGIAKYFSYFVFSSDIGFRKESVKFYETCLEVARVTPNNCIMVGDNYYRDIVIPSRLDIHTIWIKNPGATSSADARAAVSLEELNKLPAVIAEIWRANS